MKTVYSVYYKHCNASVSAGVLVLFHMHDGNHDMVIAVAIPIS